MGGGGEEGGGAVIDGDGLSGVEGLWWEEGGLVVVVEGVCGGGGQWYWQGWKGFGGGVFVKNFFHGLCEESLLLQAMP
ncbi:hypothetical protein QJS04_geneDACA001538 [Acorus gramineus]|uniref:Uncharacterized protein n=1 Tax=Acorus gramineus TaxID=55184 RepID=A0AAV9BJ06_ACOGR|nr:hypothetical protein QJS04_geneDACA001538 [Acorus gramineus]